MEIADHMSSGFESLSGVLYYLVLVLAHGLQGVWMFLLRLSAGDIAHKWFDGQWYGWESLGNPPGGAVTSDPDAVSWGNGRIDLFVRGADNALWHKWFQNGWSNWESLGGVSYSGPGSCSWASGRLDVFVKALTGDIAHKWFDGQWYGWESLGNPPGGAVTSDPDAVSWGNGRINLFCKRCR